MLRRWESIKSNSAEEGARYRAIVESQTEPICRFRPDGTLIFVNQPFCQLFGLSREQLLGYNYFSLLSEKARAELQHFIVSLRPANPPLILEYAHQTSDGRTLWQSWITQGIFTEAEGSSEIQAIAHDITPCKMAGIAAAQQTRKLTALHSASLTLLSTLEIEPLLGRILDAAASAIPSTNKGMLHLIARDTGQLEMRAVLGYTETDPRIQKFTFPGKKGYIAQAVSERRPLLILDAQADWPISYGAAKPSDDSAVRAVIVAPLVLDDHVLGALSLESNSPAAFSEADLEVVESFAAIATAAIRNALLHAEVQKQAITDPLTGVYNRRALFDLGKREVERANRFSRPLAAIMLDIDRFKDINDLHGHAAGDQVLRIVAEQCSSNIRKVDILGRYGGDEFAILLPEIEVSTASSVAERLRQSIAELRVPRGGKALSITASMGIAKISHEIANLENLLQHADTALYTAKQSGRNRIETY